MKLHVFPYSPNSRKVLMVNAATGLNLPIEIVDITTGVQKSPEFLKLNPNGRVPVLEFDDGSTLWESNIIANRLAGQAKSDLWPQSDVRYDILRWQSWEGCHWTPVCARFASKYIFGNEDVDLDAAAEAFHPFAKVLDDHLDGRDWLVGEAMTTADISCAMVTMLHESCHYPMEGYRNILGWLGRVEETAGYQSVAAMLPKAAE